MIDFNSEDMTFQNSAEVEAYCSFFLKVRPTNSLAEFRSQEDLDEFDKRRERALRVQLDELQGLDFSKANRSKVEATYTKIAKSFYAAPLSSEGSNKANTRFNFKEIPLLKNKTIYFGKTKIGCEYELFHLEDYRKLLRSKFAPVGPQHADDIIFPEYTIYEYQVSIDNILVLTSKPSCDAIKIQTRVILNEWFEHNFQFDIPTAGQVLAALARSHGFNGIQYTSTRIQTETNLVIFEENTGELKFKQLNKNPYHQPSEWLLK
jgi:hypothetical protein